MKKVMLILFLAIGTSQMSNAQIDFGIKGGVNYNSDSFQEVQTDVLSGAEATKQQDAILTPEPTKEVKEREDISALLHQQKNEKIYYLLQKQQNKEKIY